MNIKSIFALSLIALFVSGCAIPVYDVSPDPVEQRRSNLSSAVDNMSEARKEALTKKVGAGSQWVGNRTFSNDINLKVDVIEGESGYIRFKGFGKGIIPPNATD